MATGMEMADAIALNFPATDDPVPSPSSPFKVPSRLGHQLDQSKVPFTAEDIETKLREAELRRQQYYESLSSKARPKSRSHLGSSLQDENHNLRIEAKLNAAHLRRLSFVAKIRMQLAKFDEQRQAAKMRYEKQRDELGLKIDSRVQKAEANRMVIFNAYRLRRERAALWLMQKKIQEGKHKESVRAAIYNRLATAEQKRLGLLEARKARVRARVLQVRGVVEFVHTQREIEKRKLKDHLEDRMLKASRQREEYLRQRSLTRMISFHSTMTVDKGVHSRKIARYWRQFKRLRKTTYMLFKDFEALGFNSNSIKSMPFEQLAGLMESPTTIQTLKNLLDRVEIHSMISLETSLQNIDHLLRHFVLSRRAEGSPKDKMTVTVGSSKQTNENQIKLSRYPVRIVLCAYMILGQLDSVFSGKSELEVALAEAAGSFVYNFELLIKILLRQPIQTAQEKISCTIPSRVTFRSQLGAFDKAWCSYLCHFVAWKVKDVQFLEDQLVRAACQLELSMMQTYMLTADDSVGYGHDIRDIQNQVLEDQRLLREKVLHLSGNQGLEHLECALLDARSRYFESKNFGISSASLNANNLLSCPLNSFDGLSITSGEVGTSMEGCQSSSNINFPLNEKGSICWVEQYVPSTFKSSADSHLNSEGAAVTENELLVNEMVHDLHHDFSQNYSSAGNNQTGLKAKVKETMEKAFWDCVMESVKQDDPDLSWILKFIREVRDELCEMSPKNWEQEIVESINLDIVSKVLKSRTLDVDYFGRILNFSLVTLQKLSAPANDDEIKSNRVKLLKELDDIVNSGDMSSASSLMIKGLRFVLQQIQILKKEICNARMRMVEPLIKGPAGFDYLMHAFARRHGFPLEASSTLPLTRQWLSSVQSVAEKEWIEYKDCVSPMTGSEKSSLGLPLNTLRTGCNLMATKSSSFVYVTGTELPECKGDRIDLLVRLGLLKLVSEIGGMTIESLPETLKLNFCRLRAVQSQLQKVIVICNSMLVLRQIILAENLASSPAEMENLVSMSVTRLSQLLDTAENVGITEIIDTTALCLDNKNILDPEKLQSKKQLMENMLRRSLQSGDPIFVQVFRAVYTAARGVVLGGSGVKGMQIVETSLLRIGGTSLTEKLVDVIEVLLSVAVVSTKVHGAWYEEVVKTL